MIPLVAGGGFVPQSLIDSSEVADSMMVVNAEKGQNGKFVIQFSFGFLLSSFQTRSCLRYHAVGPGWSATLTLPD